MADVPINDLASMGLIKDIPAYQLPPEAFTEALNGRFKQDGWERLPGFTQVFGTLSGAPYFVLPLKTPAGEVWWIYCSLTAAFLYNGSTHDDITRAVGGAYNATGAENFNATFLGGIPIINNGADDPQFLADYSAGTNLADLTNWPANSTAKVFRAFGPTLVAVNNNDNGTNYPHLVRWSHPADPGSVPSSWDYTDDTIDAGRTDLPDTESGPLLNALMLRNQMVLYKEAATWLMRRIGGQFIFSFDPFLVTSGLLNQRCVSLTGDGKYHFVVTQDDIIIHDGNQAQSIVDKRMRRTIFNQLSTQTYGKAFVFANPFEQEMWFAYPEAGNTAPTRALVWSYGAGPQGGVLFESEFTAQCAATGDLEEAGSTWDSLTNTWDAASSPWSTSDRRKVVIGDPVTSKLYEFDDGTTRDGAAFTATLAREFLAVIGRRRSGEPIVDFTKRKLVTRIWPKIEGGPINIRVGVTDTVLGSITWSATQSFNPATQLYCDFSANGQTFAVEFSGNVAFKVKGYTVEVFIVGRF